MRPPNAGEERIRHNMGSSARRTDADRACRGHSGRRSVRIQTFGPSAADPTMTVDEQLAYLTKGCVDVVRAAELRLKLERSAATGRPLVVKVGFDPTAPDLHLGHTVLIRKMKHFQDLGHTVIYVVGSFTGAHRRSDGPLEDAAAADAGRDRSSNAETYKTQVFKILDPAEDRGPLQQRVARAARQLRLGAAGRAVQRRADARAPRLQEALRDRPADRAPRVPVSARAGVRLGLPQGRRRARRHRSALQPQRRPRPDAGLRPRAADRDDDAAARGARRRREDVEEPRQLCRRHRPAGGDVRQADVDLRRADVEVLHAPDRPHARTRSTRAAARSRPASCIRRRRSPIWR